MSFYYWPLLLVRRFARPEATVTVYVGCKHAQNKRRNNVFPFECTKGLSKTFLAIQGRRYFISTRQHSELSERKQRSEYSKEEVRVQEREISISNSTLIDARPSHPYPSTPRTCGERLPAGRSMGRPRKTPTPGEWGPGPHG